MQDGLFLKYLTRSLEFLGFSAYYIGGNDTIIMEISGIVFLK